jgi:hypothetical protein
VSCIVSHDFDKEHVKCVVHRIPNDDRIVDSSRAAIVLNQYRLSFRRDCEQYCPTGHLRSIDSKRLTLPPDAGLIYYVGLTSVHG